MTHHFIVVYNYNKYEKFSAEDQDRAVEFVNKNPGSKLYLIRYFAHRDEMLPYSTRVVI